jgi:hypothetical protein
MTYQQLHKKGRALLEDYFSLQMSTKDVIDYYLEQFETINDELKKLNGPSRLNIIKFPKDKQDLDQLPETLTVYRGYREHDKRDGISWSLSRRVAEVFAYAAAILGTTDGLETELNAILGKIDGREFHGNLYSKADRDCLPSHLIVGQCDRADVLAYTNAGSEQEIIINPAKVRDITDLQVRERNIVIPSDDYIARAEPLDWLLSTKQQ